MKDKNTSIFIWLTGSVLVLLFLLGINIDNYAFMGIVALLLLIWAVITAVYYYRRKKHTASGEKTDSTSSEGTEKPSHLSSRLGNVLYQIEHILLRNLFFTDTNTLLGILTTEDAFYGLIGKILDKEKLNNPFKATDIKVTPIQIDEDTRLVLTEFPEPEFSTLCYRIYFVFDKELAKKEMYTIEAARQGGAYLCKWSGSMHTMINHVADPLPGKNNGLMRILELKIIEDMYRGNEGRENSDKTGQKTEDKDAFTGLDYFVRDVDLPAGLFEKYKEGQIIRGRGFTDASNRIGGMVTAYRYIICSNRMGHLAMFENNTNWGLCVAKSGSRFKVLGICTQNDKTAIILLHLPDDDSWKAFRDVVQANEKTVYERAKQLFAESCGQPPIPELVTEEWRKRCEFPLGMSDAGELWDIEDNT